MEGLALLADQAQQVLMDYCVCLAETEYQDCSVWRGVRVGPVGPVLEELPGFAGCQVTGELQEPEAHQWTNHPRGAQGEP